MGRGQAAAEPEPSPAAAPRAVLSLPLSSLALPQARSPRRCSSHLPRSLRPRGLACCANVRHQSSGWRPLSPRQQAGPGPATYARTPGTMLFPQTHRFTPAGDKASVTRAGARGFGELLVAGAGGAASGHCGESAPTIFPSLRQIPRRCRPLGIRLDLLRVKQTCLPTPPVSARFLRRAGHHHQYQVTD